MNDLQKFLIDMIESVKEGIKNGEIKIEMEEEPKKTTKKKGCKCGSDTDIDKNPYKNMHKYDNMINKMAEDLPKPYNNVVDYLLLKDFDMSTFINCDLDEAVKNINDTYQKLIKRLKFAKEHKEIAKQIVNLDEINKGFIICDNIIRAAYQNLHYFNYLKKILYED